MDDSCKCSDCKNEKISLKLSKNSNNQIWQVKQCHTTDKTNKSFEEPREAGTEKPSLKVSLPISIWNTMQEQKNARCKTPITYPITTHLLSLPPARQTRSFGASNTSDLRMFRHPVPKRNTRTLLADQTAKTPAPEPSKTRFDTPPVNKEPEIEMDKTKPEECNVASKPKTPVEKNFFSYDFESPVQIKHKLPFTVVPHKGSYIKKTANPINKDNKNAYTQTTAEQATQTEICLIVTDEDYKMLEIIKNSNLTSVELQNHLDNIKKGKQEKRLTVTDEDYEMLEKIKNSNLTSVELQNHLDNIKKEKQEKNNDPIIIDLENSPEEDTNDMYVKVMKQSTKNKFVLNEVVKMMQKYYGLTSQPSTSSVEPVKSIERRQSRFAVAGATENVSKPPFHVHYSLKPNNCMASTLLIGLGFRCVRIPLQTQGTQTEESREYNKKRKLHSTTEEDQSPNELTNSFEQNIQRSPVVVAQPSLELPMLMAQQQDMPVFRSPNPARQQQQQQYASEPIERSAQFYPNMSSVMPHQRAQYASIRNHYSSTTAAHYPYQHRSGTTTINTPQTLVQMPTPGQLYPNDPRRQSLYSQMAMGRHPRLSRVLSTHEANMHGSQAHQPTWNYANYYDSHGSMYTQRHQ